MNETATRQIFGHLFKAASHLLRARESPAHPASASAPASAPGGGTRSAVSGGATKAAPIKPLVLKRLPSCCVVKASDGHGGK